MPEKMQQIVDAIKALNPNTDFTSGNKPKVEVLEAVLGYNVSADERNAAWQAISQAADSETDQINDQGDEPTEQTATTEPTKPGPVTIADVVKARRAQGMKI